MPTLLTFKSEVKICLLLMLFIKGFVFQLFCGQFSSEVGFLSSFLLFLLPWDCSNGLLIFIILIMS